MRLRPAQQTAATVLEWLRQDRRVAAGLLVGIEGSAPLDVGASMYVDADGQIDGSVTGGCVEGAVAQEAISLLAGDGRPHVQTYGISDELAGTVGLMCGGTVHIFVHELTEPSRDAAIAGLEALVQERPCTVATLLDGPGAGNKVYVDASVRSGTLGGPELLDRNVEREARGLIAHGRSTVRYFGEDGATMGTGLRVYFSVYANAPRMLIFGAIDFSAALAAIADLLGYEVTIADPRRAFLDSARFSSVANTIEAWPQDVIRDLAPGPRDAVLVFTHDAKLDVPALIAAFETEAGYIGALGSRKTTVDRERRLREAGASDADLDRMYAPCGLDIGAATVEETSIAVMAEITAHRAQRSGASLRETRGSVRGERSSPAQVEAAVGP
ncbi:MAG: XdhC family protein [Solirubrobacterales bacterium]|nr:XdhC family protein [Solirubrobacterales bacterium]MBV9473032.1 XdhC family protein [Solirubrobacterales bacterium]